MRTDCTKCRWLFQPVTATIGGMMNDVEQVVIDQSYPLTKENIALLLAILEGQPGTSRRGNTIATNQPDGLSRSELRILRYLPTNLSRPAIARELYVSVNTVNTHIRNIYSKLDARNRAQAVENARQRRLLAG